MKTLFTSILLFFTFQLGAQDTLVKEAPLQGFNVSGNYRFFAQHRLFTNPYAFQVLNDNPEYLTKRAIIVGDASQLPELTLNMGGSPSKGTSFGTDLVIWNQNNGNFEYYHNLQLGINLYGNFSTKFANIGIKAGGIHWHSMTSFTMKSFAGYNRYSIFDRNPWDPQFKDLNKRYEDYYKNGAISQDTRWAQQAVQGFILDLTELPLGLSLNMMYGKTQNAGAAFVDPANVSYDTTSNNFIKFYDNTIPNNVIAGSITKTFNKNRISLNTFNRKTYSDALATEEIKNSILTSEFYFEFDKFSVLGEIGAGHYQDVYKDLGVGEMVSLKVNLKKSLTKIPLEIHYYRINPDVINNNAEFIQDWLDEIEDGEGNLEDFFEPLDSKEKRKVEKLYREECVITKQKGKRYVLRIYALRIDLDTYLITGGAIKWSDKMDGHVDTRNELTKFTDAINYLSENGIFDKDSLIDLQNED